MAEKHLSIPSLSLHAYRKLLIKFLLKFSGNDSAWKNYHSVIL